MVESTTTTTVTKTTTATDTIALNQLPKTKKTPVTIPAGLTKEDLQTIKTYVVDATILEAAIGNN